MIVIFFTVLLSSLYTSKASDFVFVIPHEGVNKLKNTIMYN